MSWLYLPELVADCSQADCLGGAQSAPSKSTNTASASCSSDSETGASISSPSGTTCEPLTDARGVERWMSSLRDSPASHFQSQDNSVVQTTNEICGRQPHEYLTKYDRDSRSWKTCQRSLLADTLEPFSGTWPRSGSMLDGMCFQQRALEHPISASGSGLWPVPSPMAGDAQSARNATATRYRIPPTGIHAGTTLTDYVTLFPTPSARDWKSSHASQATMQKNTRPLNETITDGSGGQLNPEWVEWLMGWPIGWTDLEPLETDKFQQWWSAHGMN